MRALPRGVVNPHVMEVADPGSVADIQPGRLDPSIEHQVFEQIKMGTITKDQTPDMDHTVIMTMEQSMIFAENHLLERYSLESGMDIATSVYINEDGHPLVGVGLLVLV